MGAVVGRRPELVSALRNRHQLLADFGFVTTLLAIPTILLSLVDHRQVLGVGTWIKPTKFFLSTGVYALTIAWAFGFLSDRQRTGRAARYIVRTTIAASVLELAIISVRAALGQQSHFNTGTFLDSAWYDVMAVGALLLVSTSAVTGVLVWRSEVLDGARRTAWAAGLVLAGTFGAVTGMVMGSRTSHTVGTAVANRSIPFLGWSLSVGDLRVAHFLGLHAMFVLPALGALVAGRMERRRAERVVRAAAVMLTLAIVGTLINALAGRGV